MEAKEQQLFEFPEMEIDKPIRLIELFGGIGSQAMALRDIGADFEHYRLVEFDKYAVASYNAIHGTTFTTTDIRDVHGSDLGIVDRDNYTYLLTYSFPCTDLSVAGKMKGMSKEDWENGKSTRSGLLWEVERILKELPDEQLPQVLLMENVPQVHAEQNMADFESWLKFLRSKGYHNFYKDLNAKDYGIPQNRDRCFCISVLSKDFIEYEFPKTVQLQKVMKDYLEETVDEKYYIKTEKADKLISQLLERNIVDSNIITADLSLKAPKKTNIANCITARENRGIANVQGEGNAVIEKEKARILGGFDSHRRKGDGFQTGYQIFDSNALCPTQLAEGGGYGILITEKQIVAMRGRNPERPTDRTPGLYTEQRLEPAPKGVANTLTTVQKDNLVLECDFYKQAVETAEKENAQPGDVIDAFNGKVRKDGISPTITTRPEGKKTAILPVTQQYRIRKLTPKECWRLMGYTDEDFEKAALRVSSSQLYKQAGNAIVKQVLMALFTQMHIKGVKAWNE